MGFDILLVGVILLANPHHALTDIIAAAIIAVAVRHAEGALRDFRKARFFSYGLIAVGVAEVVFKYIFHLELWSSIAEVWRYGILIPIGIYLISGISDFAIINENAEILTRAQGLKKPLYVSCIIAASVEALAVLVPFCEAFSFVARIVASIVIAMLAAVVYRCYKSVTTPKIDTEENKENIENKS